MDCDILIVGAGPAGLGASIKLKQLLPDLEVCVVEKASEVGAHILSGNCFEPRALDELIPDWRNMDSPIKTPVTDDKILFLTESYGLEIPQFVVPAPLKNEGNYVISLSETTRWLGEQAQDLGVQIYPGFPAASILYNSEGGVDGIVTGDFGIDKEGNQKPTFQPGIEIVAKQTIFAEGCRGSLSQKVIKQFKLTDFYDGERRIIPQTYGIGIKQVWKVPNSRPGLVLHTLNWPLGSEALGGGFLYTQAPDLVHVGHIVCLDYKNPYLNPYKEFQKYKTHPKIRQYLEGGQCIAYGGRALNEGGFYSVPKLTFPGGMLVGCSAGFMNTAKIKGTHTAIKSGMLAAEAIAEAYNQGDITGKEIASYYSKYRKSWIWDQLHEVRHFRDGFEKNLYWGQVHSFLSYNFAGGRKLGFNTMHENKPDSEKTGFAKDYKPIDYPKPDGILTFDLLTSLSLTNTDHEADQPVHLKVKPGMEEKPVKYSLELYDGPEGRFCPAGVYEFVEGKLVINAQNCIHCKTCDIKTPGEYIEWTTPEGNGGPFQ